MHMRRPGPDDVLCCSVALSLRAKQEPKSSISDVEYSGSSNGNFLTSRHDYEELDTDVQGQIYLRME